MTYTANVKLDKEEFDRINKLLSLPYFDEMTSEEMRETGAQPHACEGIFAVTFKDGSQFTYDLCSGGENYFDDMLFSTKDREPIILECDFELGRKIEFDHDGNTYVINIDLDEQTALYKMLFEHAGHDVQISNYGNGANMTLECNDCGCVIFDTDCYDLKGLD